MLIALFSLDREHTSVNVFIHLLYIIFVMLALLSLLLFNHFLTRRLMSDKNFAQQHLQLHGERSGFRSSLGAGPSTWVPPATTPQSGFPMARSQPMMTPIQSPYITTRNLSNVYATPPQVGNIQHSLASYPQLYRPSTSMSTNSYSVLVRGISNRLIPINIPPTSTLYPHLSPQPTPPTYLVDPRLSLNGIHISHLMDVANQFGFNSQNFRPNM